MGRNRFQTPDIVRLPLSDDDWVEVKKRLSGGEARRMSAAAFTDVSPGNGDGKIGVNFATLSLARLKFYLVDWSFTDANDKPRKLTPDAIEALDEDTMKEIEDALDAHIKATAEEKKLTTSVST